MKPLLWIVVAVVLVGIGWYVWSQQNTPAPAGTDTGAPSTESSGGLAPQGTSAGVQSGSTLSSGASNASLDADLNQIDTQVNAAQTDSSAASNSLNDQPVQQTE